MFSQGLGKWQTALFEKRFEGLMTVAVGERAGGEMMEELAAAEAVEPAVKGGEKAVPGRVVGLKPCPVSGKVDPLQKFCQVGGDFLSLAHEGASRFLPVSFSTGQPLPEQGKAAGMIKTDRPVRFAEKAGHGRPGAERNPQGRAGRGVDGGAP